MLCVLTIAGSDSCAGAGIQMDMKTAAAHGMYAACAVTAVTAQNTREVAAVHPVDPDIVRAQIEAVFADVPVAAVKVGMLATAQTVEAVAEALSAREGVPVVVDPVLAATAGAELASTEAARAIRDVLVPRATLLTPNLPEAAALSGTADAPDAAARFLDRGASAVLVTGGHGSGDAIEDRLFTAAGGGPACEIFAAERLPGEFHGTGCSLSMAIACRLAAGASLSEAVAGAHAYLADALRHETGFGSATKMFDPLNRLDRPYGKGRTI